MDLGKLFLAAASLDADEVAQVLVPGRYRGVDPQKAAKVDLAFGLDLQLLDGDPAHRALRDVPHGHAGIERREQMFLGIGERIAAAEFGWLVDIDRKAARNRLSANSERFDLRSAVRLPLPV